MCLCSILNLTSRHEWVFNTYMNMVFLWHQQLWIQWLQWELCNSMIWCGHIPNSWKLSNSKILKIFFMTHFEDWMPSELEILVEQAFWNFKDYGIFKNYFYQKISSIQLVDTFIPWKKASGDILNVSPINFSWTYCVGNENITLILCVYVCNYVLVESLCNAHFVYFFIIYHIVVNIGGIKH